MKYLLASLLSLACVSAFAQTCPTINTATAPLDLLPCEPTAVHVRVNAAGVTPWTWCGNDLRFAAIPWAEAAPFVSAAPSIAVAQNKRAAILALEPLIHWKPSEARDVWCEHWPAMQASKPVVWVVAPALSSAIPTGTRPAYAWNGTRGAVAGRATSGTLCNPSIGRVEGTSAYYGVNSNMVALCVRR